jgi:hypothetical protein
MAPREIGMAMVVVVVARSRHSRQCQEVLHIKAGIEEVMRRGEKPGSALRLLLALLAAEELKALGGRRRAD